MSDTTDKITREEMIELFGEEMPIEAVKLLFNSDDSLTIGDIRAQLRDIAAKRIPPLFARFEPDISVEPTPLQMIDPRSAGPLMPNYDHATALALASIAISLERIADQGDRVENVEVKDTSPESTHPDGWFMHDGDRHPPLTLHPFPTRITIEVELVTGSRVTAPALAFAWHNVKRWRLTK